MVNESITKSDLKKFRGWTDNLIKTFLHTPDEEFPHPRYNNVVIKKYRVDRIEKIEASEEFKTLLEKTKLLKASAKQAVKTKIIKLIKSMDDYKPDILLLDKDELFKQAVKHYNNHKDTINARDNRFHYEFIENIPEEGEFLYRISGNYIRHCLTDYDKILRNKAKKVGIDEVYCLLKRKILDEVSSLYPFIKPDADEYEYLVEEEKLLKKKYGI